MRLVVVRFISPLFRSPSRNYAFWQKLIATRNHVIDIRRWQNMSFLQRTTLRKVSTETWKRLFHSTGSKASRDGKLKPFTDIPGPKPLPKLGNWWRYLLGTPLNICFFTNSPVNVFAIIALSAVTSVKNHACLILTVFR